MNVPSTLCNKHTLLHPNTTIVPFDTGSHVHVSINILYKSAHDSDDSLTQCLRGPRSVQEAHGRAAHPLPFPHTPTHPHTHTHTQAYPYTTSTNAWEERRGGAEAS